MSILGNSISTGSARHHDNLWTGTIKGMLWCVQRRGCWWRVDGNTPCPEVSSGKWGRGASLSTTSLPSSGLRV